MDKPIAKLKLLTTKDEVVDAILYCHQETTTIAGTTYRTLKLNTPADASGTTLSASTGSVARVVWGKFVYPLTGIVKILASTIYATYRAYTGGGTVNAEIDILIREADGTVRTTIATGVSKSANLGTSWATYTGANYSFAEYTVVDQTDYLEIDYIANVTARKSGQYAYLRIDDNTLALADQTRSQEWKFTGATTLNATDITINSATLNGKINGTETMTVRGFEWGTQSGNYTDSWTETGTFPPDTFSHTITGLTSGRTYYFRAKAYSDATGWIYGNELSFTTLTPAIIFSDGFESGDFSAWTATGGSGTHSETVVTSPVHHGSYAAKLYVEGDSESYARKSFTQQTPVYFRVYLQSSATPSSGWALTLLYLYYSAYYQYGAYVRWVNDAGTLKWELAVKDDGAEWHYARSTTPTINTNQWYCVELKVDSATEGNGEARLYVDGTEIASLTGLTMTETGKPDTAEIRVYNYPVTTSVYYDCVVVANTYIGPEAVLIETIVAKNFPMDYLPSPVKAAQLTSKVSGATIQQVSQDYPLTLIKKDKAQELMSKFSAT
jgi:hypothetical protein